MVSVKQVLRKVGVIGAATVLLVSGLIIVPARSVEAGVPQCDGPDPLAMPGIVGGVTRAIGSLPVSFNGDHSFGCEDEIVSFHWDFGDGTSAEGSSAVHTYGVGTCQPVLTVTDEAGLSDQGITMQIQVKADNQAPVISGVVATTVEPGEWAVIPVGEVASDPAGDQLSWSAPQVPAGSPAERVEYFGGGKYQYHVPADTTATSDSFTYTVDDGFGGTAQGEVHVTIGQRPSQPPVAVDDTAVKAEDETVSINVGSNDSDPDTANLSYALGTQPAHGNATVWPDGTADYRPAADFTGTDTFTYTVSDGDTTATAAVTVTVTPVNDAPAAQSDTERVVEDGSITFDPTANDTDTDGDALHLVSVGVSRYSTSVTQNADGTLTVRPAADKTLDDSFTYVVSDGTMQSTGTVRVDIVPVNDAPVASFSTSTLKPRTVVASATASDVDGDTLSYSWNWGDGTTTTTASPSARHDYARRGSYTLTLTVSDGQGGQAVTTKTVTF